MPGNPVFDMGAIDILRARERGVPRYNELRRELQPRTASRTLRRAHGRLRHVGRTLARCTATERGAGRHRRPGPAGGERLRHAPPRRTSGSARPSSRSSSSTPVVDSRATGTSPTTSARRSTRADGLDWIDDVTIEARAAAQLPGPRRHRPGKRHQRLRAMGHRTLGSIRLVIPCGAYNPDLKAEPWRGDAH